MELTRHVREEQDAVVEAERKKGIPEHVQQSHADAQRERRRAEQQRVPQVEDLWQRENIYEEQEWGREQVANEPLSVYFLLTTLFFLFLLTTLLFLFTFF